MGQGLSAVGGALALLVTVLGSFLSGGANTAISALSGNPGTGIASLATSGLVEGMRGNLELRQDSRTDAGWTPERTQAFSRAFGSPVPEGSPTAASWFKAPGPRPANINEAVFADALHFLRRMGQTTLASRLQEMKEENRIRFEILDARDFAETVPARRTITLNRSKIGRFREGPSAWTQVMSVAGTLAHEYEHIKQGQTLVDWSDGLINRSLKGDPQWAEVFAWGLQFNLQTEWILALEKSATTLSASEATLLRQTLRELAALMKSGIADFEQNEFAPAGPEGFKLLRWVGPGGMFGSAQEAIAFLDQVGNR